jgi:hypothetical protein
MSKNRISLYHRFFFDIIFYICTSEMRFSFAKATENKSLLR